MILPGQSKPVSKKLTAAIESVEEGLGRDIIFLPLAGRHDSLLTSNVGGYHDNSDGAERVWLDASMPYAAEEALAAHELAHIMQLKEGYPRVWSIRDAGGKPLVPALEHLAARVDNLVRDESADLWAIAHGFDMGKALGHIGLKTLVTSLNHKTVEREAASWDAYFAGLRKLAREVSRPGRRKSFEVGPEVETQVMIVDYAGLSLRFGRYGLFGGLDETWEAHWPLSRTMGKELAEIITKNGVENPAKCREALHKSVAFLKIPTQLISVG